MERFITIAVILLFLSASAFADGMAIKPCIEGGWCPYRESSQRAIINYENGYENLLLFVHTEGTQAEKFLWIFPVPAKPETIEINNLKSFPNLSGTPLKKQLKDNIGGLAIINFVALFPPAGIIFVAMMTGLSSTTGATYQTENALGKGIDRGYEIYSHIDKYGIATEVMSAWDSTKFYHYLEVRGTNVSPDAKKRIDEYIGKDYSFIVSWISNPEEYRQQQNQGGSYYYNQEPIGVFVRFPTEKIYYPMKMTSVYESNYIPATIDVIGYWEPEVFANISKETKTEYFFQDRLQYGLNEEESALKVFNGNVPQQIRFTRISINAQAKYFIQDLFVPNKSLSAGAFEAINAVWIILAIIIFFALSFMAIWATNKIALASFLDNKKIALLALANFLTIIGFVAAVFVLKERFNAKEKPKFSRLKTIIGFWLVFFGLSILFGLLAIAIGITMK